jgi:hypothetical protein
VLFFSHKEKNGEAKARPYGECSDKNVHDSSMLRTKNKSRPMWRNPLEASAISRSPRCLVVSPSLILREKHQARGSLVVKDQTAYHLGSWTIEDVG